MFFFFFLFCLLFLHSAIEFYDAFDDIGLARAEKTATGLNHKELRIQGTVLIQQKDLKIAKGLNRMMELEQMLKGIEAENQTWERVAKEHEAIITSMNKTMEQLQQDTASQSRIGRGGGVEDAESCCDIGYLDSAKAEESRKMGK